LLIDAYMNHGRWVADCPAGNETQLETFTCGTCGYSALVDTGHAYIECLAHGWHSVRFPAERKEIEAVLRERPVDELTGAKHANWRPGETVESLRAENVGHGVNI
jgi:hypothetical protein